MDIRKLVKNIHKTPTILRNNFIYTFSGIEERAVLLDLRADHPSSAVRILRARIVLEPSFWRVNKQ
jgi:hypothetical protein